MGILLFVLWFFVCVSGDGGGLDHDLRGRVRSQFNNHSGMMRDNLVFNDPLFLSQWHLKLGDEFSLQMQGAWGGGFSGDGIVIGVVVESADETNPDLVDRVVRESSNVKQMGKLLENTKFGTAAASLILATGNNHFCSVGVAPSAKLVLLEGWEESPTEASFEPFFSSANTVDIYWFSHGMNHNGYLLMEDTNERLKRHIHDARDGKGAIVVGSCSDGKYQSTCNQDAFNIFPEVILVGQINKQGDPVGNQICSKFLVAAPTKLKSTFDSSCSTDDKLTGYQAPSALVAGVAALLLEKNPELTWYDIQNILVHTATEQSRFQPDWQINGAGLPFSHAMGFGVLNVTKALEFLNYHNESDPSARYSEQYEFPVWSLSDCDGTTATLFSFVELPVFGTIQHIQVDMDVTHPSPGDLEVRLTSPSGTHAILMTQRTTDYARGPRLKIGNEFNLDLWFIDDQHARQSQFFRDIIFAEVASCCDLESCKPYLFKHTGLILIPDPLCPLQQQLQILRSFEEESRNQKKTIEFVIVFSPDNHLQMEVESLTFPFPVMGGGSFYTELVLDTLKKSFLGHFDIELDPRGAPVAMKSTSIPPIETWVMGSTAFWGEKVEGIWTLSIHDTLCGGNGRLNAAVMEVSFTNKTVWLKGHHN